MNRFMKPLTCALALSIAEAEWRPQGGERVARVGPLPPPMVLSGVGQTVRRSLALVLHDSSKPWTILAPDWTSTEACTGG
jgi:hypothetical protein